MPALIALLPLITSLFDRLVPDPNQRATEQAAFISAITKMSAEADKAQTGVNAEEAKHNSIFVAGWRPFIGWIGGAALAWQFVLRPMLLAFATYFDERFVTALLNAPTIDNNLWELICGMLGIGALRTFEKIKRAA